MINSPLAGFLSCEGAVFAFSGISAVEGHQALSLTGAGVYPPDGLTGCCNGRMGPGDGFPAVRPSHTVKLMNGTPPDCVVLLHAGGVLGAARPMPPEFSAVIPAVGFEAPNVILDAPVVRRPPVGRI